MRLRNTQYVQIWYASTIGTIVTATIVMTFSVYGLDAASWIVIVHSGLSEEIITFGYMYMNTVIVDRAMVNPVMEHAQPSLPALRKKWTESSAAPARIGIRPGLTPRAANSSVS